MQRGPREVNEIRGCYALRTTQASHCRRAARVGLECRIKHSRRILRPRAGLRMELAGRDEVLYMLREVDGGQVMQGDGGMWLGV